MQASLRTLRQRRRQRYGYFCVPLAFSQHWKSCSEFRKSCLRLWTRLCLYSQSLTGRARSWAAHHCLFFFAYLFHRWCLSRLCVQMVAMLGWRCVCWAVVRPSVIRKLCFFHSLSLSGSIITGIKTRGRQLHSSLPPLGVFSNIQLLCATTCTLS